MLTIKEAARALGIDGNTLRDWIDKAEARARLEHDAVDKRLVYVPDDLLAQLAEAHKRSLVQQTPDLAVEVAELRRRVEALERKAARGSLSAKSDGAQAAHPPSDSAPAKAPESSHRRASGGIPDAGGDIPSGWIRSVTFAKERGIHPNTFSNWIAAGKVPTTRRPDPLRSDGKDEVWLTPDQQAAALAYARERGHVS